MHLTFQNPFGLEIKSREWLIEKKDLRFSGQSSNERNPLAHSAGELMRISLLELAEPIGLQKRPRARARRVASPAKNLQPQFSVLEHRSPLE